MKNQTLRWVRNLAFAVLVAVSVAATQRGVQAQQVTWCSHFEDGCDPEWCGQMAIICYSYYGFNVGCWEDSDPSCGCAFVCDLPY